MTKYRAFGFRTAMMSAGLLMVGIVTVAAQEADDFALKLEELKQDLESSTQNAVTATGKEEYGNAAVEFDYAAQYSRQLRIYSLASYLPKAQDGFSAQKLQASQPSQSPQNVGYASNQMPLNSVRQEYVKGDQIVILTITADAANSVQQMTTMINNPAQLSTQYSTERINGQRALVQKAQTYQSSSNAAKADDVTVSLPFNGNYMIVGAGPKEATVAHLSALDFNGLMAVR